jgi:hypothetical protein
LLVDYFARNPLALRLARHIKSGKNENEQKPYIHAFYFGAKDGL